MARCKIVPNPPLSIICRRGKRSLWRLIKYFAKAGEPRERAELRRRCLPTARLGSPGLSRASPRGSAGLSRSLTAGRGLCRCMWLSAAPSHSLPPQKRDAFLRPSHADPSNPGREDGVKRARGMPTPGAPGRGTPCVSPLPEAGCALAPSAAQAASGQTLPSARQ